MVSSDAILVSVLSGEKSASAGLAAPHTAAGQIPIASGVASARVTNGLLRGAVASTAAASADSASASPGPSRMRKRRRASSGRGTIRVCPVGSLGSAKEIGAGGRCTRDWEALRLRGRRRG